MEDYFNMDHFIVCSNCTDDTTGRTNKDGVQGYSE